MIHPRTGNRHASRRTLIRLISEAFLFEWQPLPENTEASKLCS